MDVVTAVLSILKYDKTTLNFYDNNIGHNGATALATALQVNTTLSNEEVGEKKIPRLPYVVWQQVFSFYCRKAF